MLAAVNITSGEQTVYTVPANARGFVFVDIVPVGPSKTATITMKINNMVYINNEQIDGDVSVKLVLDPNDSIRVGLASGSEPVNVFVHGMIT